MITPPGPPKAVAVLIEMFPGAVAAGRSRTGCGARGGYPPPPEGATVSAEIENRVVEIVCEHLAVNKETVTRNTAFIEDIGADSLDIVELVMELEEEFDIQIPDDQAEKIKTVGEAIDYIEKAVGDKQQP